MTDKPIDIEKLSGDFVNAATSWIKANPRLVLFMLFAFVFGIVVGRCR